MYRMLARNHDTKGVRLFKDVLMGERCVYVLTVWKNRVQVLGENVDIPTNG